MKKDQIERLENWNPIENGPAQNEIHVTEYAGISLLCLKLL